MKTQEFRAAVREAAPGLSPRAKDKLVQIVKDQHRAKESVTMAEQKAPDVKKKSRKSRQKPVAADQLVAKMTPEKIDDIMTRADALRNELCILTTQLGTEQRRHTRQVRIELAKRAGRAVAAVPGALVAGVGIVGANVVRGVKWLFVKKQSEECPQEAPAS